MWLDRRIGAFRVGLLLVYLSFFAMSVPAIMASRFHFSRGHWVIGVWSLVSIFIVPKAVLGLVLLIGRESGLWLGMSFLECRLYPRTTSRKRQEDIGMPTSFGGTPVWRAYLRELGWLSLG